MTPTRFLVGQILVVFAIVIGGLRFSTEWLTAAVGYRSRLGLLWFGFCRYKFITRVASSNGGYAFDAHTPMLFNTAGIMAASRGVAGAVVAVIGSLWLARRSRLADTCESSHWASRSEFEAVGLLGQLKDRYLRHDGAEHVMAFAPTRSGKGVGLVIPTLLSWTVGAVLNDINAKNWHLTAVWRARRLQRTYAAHRLEPLLSIKPGSGPAAAGAKRGDATAAGGRAGPGRKPGADPRQEAALLPRLDFTGPILPVPELAATRCHDRPVQGPD